MSVFSLMLLAAIEKVVLLLLPSIVFPAIYLAYLRTYSYRLIEIDSLVSSVKQIRSTELDPSLKKDLVSELDFLYNWKNYLVPVLMSCFFTLLATFAALSRAHVSLGMPEIQNKLFDNLNVSVLAGIAGAYIASLADLTDRARRRNLSWSAFQNAWVKMIGGAVLGYLASTLVVQTASIWVAFGLGVLPLKESLQIAMDKARKALERTAASEPAVEPPNLHNLQGMTEDLQNILRDQGIDSAEQLAYASPIKLLARTSFEWVTIIDLIDQALLFNYFGENIAKFRSLGIRGSIEMGTLYYELHCGDPVRQAEADSTVNHVAMYLPNMDRHSVEYAIRTLNEDLTVKRIAYLFGGRMGTPAPVPSPQPAPNLTPTKQP